MQESLRNKGGITLIDEVEHGLEPHRVRRLLRFLQNQNGKTVQPASSDPGVGQLVMTTHSETVVDELCCDRLRIVRSHKGVTRVLSIGKQFQGNVWNAPEAFLGTALIVCEGATEVGFCRALDAWWSCAGAYEPFAVYGIVPVDGEGASAPGRAKALRQLEYTVAYFGDSDCPLSPSLDQMRQLHIEVVIWDGDKSLEERVALDLPWPGILEILDLAADIRGEEKVRGGLIKTLGKESELLCKLSELIDTPQLRTAIGATAKKGEWFKRIDYGELLGNAVTKYLSQIQSSDLARKTATLRAWIDSHGT
jgi:hypothetical protein